MYFEYRILISIELIHRYFQQLTKGCGMLNVNFVFLLRFRLYFSIGNEQCLNVYCSSSSSFKYDREHFKNANNVAAEALKLTADHNSAYLDEYINSNLFLIEENLQQIINKSKELNNWSLIQNTIQSVFSNRQNLSSSFLRTSFPINLSVNNDTSSAQSVTPKSKFHSN
jgi:hypothetical protein